MELLKMAGARGWRGHSLRRIKIVEGRHRIFCCGEHGWCYTGMSGQPFTCWTRKGSSAQRTSAAKPWTRWSITCLKKWQ